jgi:hypothetical protein
MEAWEIEFDFTVDGVVAFARYQADYLPDGRKKPKTAPWAWVALLVLLVVGVGYNAFHVKGLLLDRLPSSLGEWFQCLLPPALLAACAFLYFFGHRLTADAIRKRYRRPENAHLLGRRKLAISPEGLALSWASGNSTIRWNAVHRVATTPTHAFFYINSASAIPLPRRAFPDDEDFEDFVAAADRFHLRARHAATRDREAQAAGEPPDRGERQT